MNNLDIEKIIIKTSTIDYQDRKDSLWLMIKKLFKSSRKYRELETLLNINYGELETLLNMIHNEIMQYKFNKQQYKNLLHLYLKRKNGRCSENNLI